MATVAQKEQKPFFRPVCNCCLLPGSHFQDKCSRINRQVQHQAWRERQLEREEKHQAFLEREQRRQAWQKAQELKQAKEDHGDDASTVVSESARLPPRPRLAFTAAESRMLTKVKCELQEIYEIQKQIDAGRKMELQLWQWRKVDGKHAQNRRKELEQSAVLQMEKTGYQTQVCHDFWNFGSCEFGERCCFRHERVQKAEVKKQQDLADETSTIADTTVCDEDDWAAPMAGDDWQVPPKVDKEEKKAKVYPMVQEEAADVWKPVEHKKPHHKPTQKPTHKPVEVRRAQDGLLYSHDDFMLHYGDRRGESMWEEALQLEIQHGSAAFAEGDKEHRLAQEKNAFNVQFAQQAAAKATRARERAEREFKAWEERQRRA